MRGLRPLVALTVGVLALGMFALWEHRLRPPLTGDEPGYLVIAESVLFDHDTNLANNFGAHARIDGALAQPAAPARSVRIESPTDWQPTEPIGLGLLLTPAVAIGHRGAGELLWARRVMMLLAALLVWQLFELAADQLPLGLAVAIAASVLLALPVVGYSNQLYPEVPAALLFTLGLRALLTTRRPHPILIGLAAAPLPWLSIRFLPLGVALIVGLVFRQAELRVADRLRSVAVACSPLAVSGLVLALVDPASVFHPPTPIAQSAINTYRIGVGGLLSPVFGLLPFAPQLVLGVVGLGLVALLHRRAGAVVVIGALAYEFVAIPFGFRGYALPARFQVVLIPLLALGVIQLLRAYPRVLAVLAVGTIAGAIVLVQAGSQPTYGALYNDPPHPVVPALKGVATILPDFSLAPGHTGAVNVASNFGAEIPLRSGRYELAVRAHPHSFDRARIIIESDATGVMRPSMEVTRSLSTDGTIAVPFAVARSGVKYEFRVETPGVSGAVDSVTVRLTGQAESRTAPSSRDVPLGLAWLAALVAAAVAATRLRPKEEPSPAAQTA